MRFVFATTTNLDAGLGASAPVYSRLRRRFRGAGRAPGLSPLANNLFYGLRFGEGAIAFQAVQAFTIDVDFEHAATAGSQCNRVEVTGERIQQFLRQPRGARQHATALAVMDFD